MREYVERAQSQVAGLLHWRPGENVFTSGGSKSNNHALKGVFFSKGGTASHIITKKVEHRATSNPCLFLDRLRARGIYLPVENFGRVDPDDRRRAVTPRMVLISVTHANSEIGPIQPIAEFARIAREHDILFQTDAVQSVGKIATDVRELGSICWRWHLTRSARPRERALCTSAMPRSSPSFMERGRNRVGGLGRKVSLSTWRWKKACELAHPPGGA